MSDRDKDRKKKALIRAVAFALIIAFVAILILLLTNKKETLITQGTQDSNATLLKCEITHFEDAFFKHSTVQNTKHEIDISLLDDRISKMTYDYTGTYNSMEAAVSAEARLHADYNKYMSQAGLSPESYNPVFNAVKTKVRISLYAELKKMNSVIGKIFSLDEDEVKHLGDYGASEMKKIYEKKSFACSLKD